MTKRAAHTLGASCLAAVTALSAAPAHGWDDPAEVAGFYRLGSPETVSDRGACVIELLAPIAYEFEGVWFVARPLHYEDNRETCRRLGVTDVIAWSGVADESIWLLAEGDAGFMTFTRADREMWRLADSGHASLPDLMLARTQATD